MVKRIICDLDDTITFHSSSESYADKTANLPLIKKLQEYKKNGYTITIFTARNMNSYNGDLSRIREKTVPGIEKWLASYNVPCDELIIGKPWCDEGFYVDDKSIRPSEFLRLSEQEILQLIK